MAVPLARYEDLVKYVDFLNEGMARFEINTPVRIAAFIAQRYRRNPEKIANYVYAGRYGNGDEASGDPLPP